MWILVLHPASVKKIFPVVELTSASNEAGGGIVRNAKDCFNLVSILKVLQTEPRGDERLENNIARLVV